MEVITINLSCKTRVHTSLIKEPHDMLFVDYFDRDKFYYGKGCMVEGYSGEDKYGEYEYPLTVGLQKYIDKYGYNNKFEEDIC